MAMRIVDRLAGGKPGEAKSELSDVVGHFHKLVLDRVDHKALSSLNPEETSAHLKREIVRLIERIAKLEESNADLKESLEDAKVTSSTSRAPDYPESGSKMAPVASYSSGFTAASSQALPTTSIGVETTIESLSAANGLIALANSPELGLSLGATVTIIKKLKALGKIQVSQVTDDLVLANLLPGAKTREMVVGTTVSLLR